MLPSASTAPAWLVLLAGLLGVVVVGLAVTAGLTDPLDEGVIRVVRSAEALEPLAFLRPITEAGSTWAVTLVGLALLAGLALRGRPWLGLAAGLTILAASLLNTGAKTFVARARPELLEPIVLERGFSFPSGHSALGMVAWGIVAVLVARSRLSPALRWALLTGLGALVALIGVSRIYLGVHYPTDVLAGWVAGATVVALFARFAPGLSPGVSRSPAAAPVGADRAERRSGPPGPE